MTSPVFVSDLYLVVFLGTVGLWIVSDLSIGLRHGMRAVSPQDRGSKRVIGMAVSGGAIGALFASIWLPNLAMPAPRLVFWIGIVLVLGGVVLRQYAVRTLGAHFSIVVSVEESDTVVTDGPYRWVRHPSYTGGLASLVGLGLALGHWVSLAVCVLAGMLGYGYRIRVEEEALRKVMGDSYEAFIEETPDRLIPFVW